ncbi:MAG: hypothetical protein V3T70_01855 [Phycisphaerae bacterium]
MRTSSILLLSWCVAGCSQPLTQSEIKALETREIDADYATVYDAALNAMFSLGLSILHSDKESGVITGQSGDHVQRAQAGLLWRGLYDVKKITLLVAAKGPHLTQIRIKVLVNETQQLDRALMTKIWQRIEREAMLESQPTD